MPNVVCGINHPKHTVPTAKRVVGSVGLSGCRKLVTVIKKMDEAKKREILEEGLLEVNKPEQNSIDTQGDRKV